MTPTTSAPQGQALIAGASLAGMLAAAAIAPHADDVTLVDADVLPDNPLARRGLPQARHAHLLWSGGARAIEQLLPGTLDALNAAGAHHIGLPADLIAYTAQGWVGRFPATEFLISCSRDLLDWVIRRQLLTAHPHIRLRQHMRITGLTGNAKRVTGATVSGPDGDDTLNADLVIDATGRGSRIPHWLTALGLPDVITEEVDSGLTYATRIFQAPPPAAQRFPLVNVQADPSTRQPGKTATILPIEDGKWLVTLSGTRGGEPPTDPESFADWARTQMRDPIVGQLLAHATPLTDVAHTRGGANRRRYLERLRPWPQGLIVIGDAVATYNPVYGQGMSVAAQGALQLRHAASRTPLSGLDTRRVQKAICRAGHTPWLVATGQDIMYPDAVGKPQPRSAKLVQAYFERYIRTAAGRPSAARRLYNAFTLSGPIAQLFSPAAIVDAIRGPSLPPLTSAPIDGDELKRAGLEHLPTAAHTEADPQRQLRP